MPPFVTRKRNREAAQDTSPPAKRTRTATKSSKPSLFETFDEPSHNPETAEASRKLLEHLNAEESSLSDVDSDDFEDVPAKSKPSGVTDDDSGDEQDDDDEDMGWENAMGNESPGQPTPGPSANPSEQDIADVSISVKDDGTFIEPDVSAGITKKGPSKRERQVRVQAHCLHVQALMWHNTIRNSWLNDNQVQRSLVNGLTEGVKREVKRWKEAMGILNKAELDVKKEENAKSKGKRAKGKQKATGRDWNYEAEHLDHGKPDLSHGDPLLRLLKVLTAYWRKKFTVTAPAIRKQGYRHLRVLRDDIKSWQKDPKNAEEHGERIDDITDFRKLVDKCEGSRDVGGQLFVALLRGLGIDARMVANLQPVGFGFSKAEEAKPKKDKKTKTEDPADSSESEAKEKPAPKEKTTKGATMTAAKKSAKPEPATRKSARGNKADPIDLDDSDSPLSSAPEVISVDEEQEEEANDDDLSVFEVLPPTPRRKKPLKKYDRDLAYPTYWAEVCSPLSNKYIPVDPIVLSTIGSNEELTQSFEPRGKKAELAKQVIAYTVGFNSDGTAKDVTVRYLKKHQLPGKTKGMRMPIEKVPVYNRRGKVKKYVEYDWFRVLMSSFDRPHGKRTIADDVEEQTDLKPFKPAKQEKEVVKESLQWYKQSAEYVLEQHLRREEAVLPGARPVKTFAAGKGDKAKEHDVYLRSDVVACKTVESWHKEGRELKTGEQPMKLVPVRAVTTARKREVEDTKRETGETMKQGLYSRDQTDWIIPPPIINGKIPKNAYGNMDVYVPTMVPKGAVHLALRGTAKLCRKLEIDYAEACTGFEFGNRRAVPIITGVVVAKENEKLVRDAWRADQAEIKRKEDTKRTAVALQWWRKMVLSLRVIERMRLEYRNSGATEEDINPFVARAKRNGVVQARPEPSPNVDMEGGYISEGQDEDGLHALAVDDEDEEMPDAPSDVCEEGGGGGFLIEDD